MVLAEASRCPGLQGGGRVQAYRFTPGPQSLGLDATVAATRDKGAYAGLL